MVSASVRCAQYDDGKQSECAYAHPRAARDSLVLLITYSRGVHWYVSTVLRAVAPDLTERE